jgi:SAM-dependent methyltransferase
MDGTGGGRDDIGEYLVSSRSLREYRAMFALTGEELRGRVLDCPGGGAGFAAAARAEGIDVVAVDPVYRTPPAELVRRLDAELDRGSRWAVENAGRYVWDFYGDPAGHRRERTASGRLFAGDVVAHPQRYVAAELPRLPFTDAAFDLVLSSHLLFSYADRLDRAFHLRALLELVRVCRGEVRVYPLVHHAGRGLPALVDGLLGDLAAAGLRAEVRPTRYEFQRGARELLVVPAPGR